MEDILKAVAEYVDAQQASKTWVAGKDMVHYAGPYYDSEEISRAVATLLKGWLVMGNDCLRFETVSVSYTHLTLPTKRIV